jgi:hypothetical protein
MFGNFDKILFPVNIRIGTDNTCPIKNDENSILLNSDGLSTDQNRYSLFIIEVAETKFAMTIIKAITKKL